MVSGMHESIRTTDTVVISNILFFSAGGVELYTLKGKIKVDNTLEARLGMVAEMSLPQVRTSLFGTNPNRKFSD